MNKNKQPKLAPSSGWSQKREYCSREQKKCIDKQAHKEKNINSKTLESKAVPGGVQKPSVLGAQEQR